MALSQFLSQQLRLNLVTYALNFGQKRLEKCQKADVLQL